MNTDKRKYIMVFLITLGIFIVVFGLVNFMNQQKLANIDDLQRKITADLIATETQFDLLKSAPCSAIKNTILSRELGELGKKLDSAQTNQGSDNPDVIQSKKYYSLLQVKDYLLMEEFSSKCDIQIESLLYFYSDDCSDCKRQGYVLTELKQRYPDLRIYSFDSDLEFSVIDTFASLYDFGDVYPTLVIHDEIYQGFVGLEELESFFPVLIQEKVKQERIERDTVFIQAQTDFKNLNPDDIVFIGYQGTVYTYKLTSMDQEETLIKVDYIDGKNEFVKESSAVKTKKASPKN